MSIGELIIAIIVFTIAGLLLILAIWNFNECYLTMPTFMNQKCRGK